MLVYTLVLLFFLHFSRWRDEMVRKLCCAGSSHSMLMTKLPVNAEGIVLKKEEPEPHKTIVTTAGLCL